MFRTLFRFINARMKHMYIHTSYKNVFRFVLIVLIYRVWLFMLDLFILCITLSKIKRVHNCFTLLIKNYENVKVIPVKFIQYFLLLLLWMEIQNDYIKFHFFNYHKNFSFLLIPHFLFQSHLRHDCYILFLPFHDK